MEVTAEERLEPPEAGKAQGGPALEPVGVAWPCRHLGVRPLASRTTVGGCVNPVVKVRSLWNR